MRFHGAAAWTARLLVSAPLLLASVGGQAAETGLQISAGIGHSDNIARTATDQKSETIGTVGADFGVLQRTSRLDLDVGGNLQWADYFDHTYDSELVGNAVGKAHFQIVPERFNWVLQDNFGQSTLDPLAPVTPGNRENVNYLSTGPDLNLPLGGRTGLRISGRYDKVDYETSPVDNDRLKGLVGLVRSISAGTRVSLDVQREKIDFSDNTLNRDYNRDEAFARYEAQGSRTRLGLDIGYSRLQGLTDSPGGLLTRLELSRQVSPSSVVSLSAGRDFSDSGDSFRLSQSLGGTGQGTISGLQTGTPFRNTYVAAGWNFSRNRTGLNVNVEHFDESYEGASGLDRKRLTLDAQLTRNLTPTLIGNVGGALSREDYDAVTGNYREKTYFAGITQRFGRRLGINAQYQRYRRTSDLAGGGYSENRVWLNFTWGSTVSRSGFDQQALPSDAAL